MGALCEQEQKLHCFVYLIGFLGEVSGSELAWFNDKIIKLASPKQAIELGDKFDNHREYVERHK
jgi:hypothetical protein